MEFGEFGGVLGEGALVHQEARRGGVGVVAQDLDHHVEEDGLAVGSLAPEEGEDLGPYVTGDGVTEQQVEEVDEFLAPVVGSEGVGEEAVPSGGGHAAGGDVGGA